MRIIIITLSLLLSGCSLVAPPYQTSVKNTQALKRSGILPVSVGQIKSTKKLNSISLRGSSLTSPINKSYGEYIANAIMLELKQAKLLSDNNEIVISGELLTNDINVAGFSEGTGEISIKLTVTNKGNVTYNKALSVVHKFDSSFLGAVAIPNAQNSYPIMLQKLIVKLISDPDFVAAAK